MSEGAYRPGIIIRVTERQNISDLLPFVTMLMEQNTGRIRICYFVVIDQVVKVFESEGLRVVPTHESLNGDEVDRPVRYHNDFSSANHGLK